LQQKVRTFASENRSSLFAMDNSNNCGHFSWLAPDQFSTVGNHGRQQREAVAPTGFSYMVLIN